jgi:hypothetical protein
MSASLTTVSLYAPDRSKSPAASATDSQLCEAKAIAMSVQCSASLLLLLLLLLRLEVATAV